MLYIVINNLFPPYSGVEKELVDGVYVFKFNVFEMDSGSHPGRTISKFCWRTDHTNLSSLLNL